MTEMISNSSNQYLEKYKNALKTNKTNSNKSKKLSNYSKNKIDNTKCSSNSAKIGSQTILAKKGQAGYLKEMDLDEDGKVSLEEFNEYCEYNGIGAKEKLAMVTAMLAANKNSKLAKDATKEESKADSKNDNAVYAKEGDEKYDEAMDENSNGVVTYAEYLKYINEKDKTKESEKSDENETLAEDNSKSNKLSETYNGETELPSFVEFEA